MNYQHGILRRWETKGVVLRVGLLEPAVELDDAPSTAALDVAGLAGLYREQASFVWRNARRLGCDDMQAEDVVHEVFLVVARRLSEFRNEASIRTWLFAITYRVVQRLTRDQRRRQRRLREYAAERVHALPRHPEERSVAHEYVKYLLEQLDECQRVVFILAELEGMTSAEIGALLGLRSPTVDSRLRAARKVIARSMNRDTLQERRQRL